MLSLSPTLPPTALRVPGSTTTPVPPGDFAAALAGLLGAPGAVVAPPVAPADRQIAAMPGKDLPAVVVAAGAIDAAPETGTLVDETVSAEAVPHPAEGPHFPVLPAPAAPPVAAPVDAVRVEEATPPTLPEALPTPAVAPALTVEREAIAPPMTSDAATPPTSPGKRAQTRKEAIAALPLPIPGTAALMSPVADGVSAPPAPIAADHASIDAGLAAVSTGEPETGVPGAEVSLPDVVPAAIDTMPAHVTDSEAHEVTDDARVAIDAPGQPAAVDSASPLVVLSTIAAALDGVAPPPAGKAPTRPPRFAAPIAATLSSPIAIERPQTPAPAIVAPAPVSAGAPEPPPARAIGDAIVSTPIDGAKNVFARAVATDSARPAPAIRADSAAPSVVRGSARAPGDVIGITQAPPLAPAAGAIPLVAASAAPRPVGLRRAVIDAAEPSIPTVASHAAAPVAGPAAQAPALHRTPLDMRRDDWTRQLIDRIETVRDMANAADTRIKLMPDALGKIDVTMRKDGDTMHVSFTADVAATRAMLAEAQPRLAELAQQRGLRLGQSSVDAGAGGHGQPNQSHQPGASRAPLPSRPMRAEHDEDVLQTGRLA
ncbi:flagellar hook-length control protein FliK [Hephaestia caeni]|uniref:Flagellar hook-length control protein FliK n=1 Tax=Hephaestia caeni TaxID=645617 RepID=A0A397P6M6_9SPHN|nr:flagellar hook-length control protein FliK [Hephaestia caeni]RIA44518.1 flagellar hook-length control protein FliK [Hephaestia caeni]